MNLKGEKMEEEKKMHNEIKDSTQLVIEMRGQVDSMLEEWATVAYQSYKANGNELAISIKLRLEGDSDNIVVKSGISFMVEKITDDREGEVRFGQEKLI